MITVLLADGFEESEAIIPVDMLRRAGLDCKTVGVYGRIAVGSHNIPVVCDIEANEINFDDVSTVILPGGMPGTLNLKKSEFVINLVKHVYKRGGRIAAICAAPSILGGMGLLKGKNAVCYPGFENELDGAKVSELSVVTDGNITTAKGMGVALEFSKELITLILNKDTAEKISRSIMEKNNTEVK